MEGFLRISGSFSSRMLEVVLEPFAEEDDFDIWEFIDVKLNYRLY